MELSNRMRKFMSVLVIFFIITIIVGIIYGVTSLITKNVFKAVDPCANSAPGAFDNCCVTQGRGNHFDNVTQKCVTIEPPKGNPSTLPLIQVTDSNNNIIRPPTGQDAMIVPEIVQKPEDNMAGVVNETNQTNQKNQTI